MHLIPRRQQRKICVSVYSFSNREFYESAAYTWRRMRFSGWEVMNNSTLSDLRME